MTVAAALAGVYLVWQPPSADLAAQTFRADLFADHGFLVWSNDWYGGFHVPGYSLLFPPLAAVLGPRLVGALAAVAAAGLFAAIAHRHYGERAWLGTLWFAAATATNLFTGRLTFALGVAVGLAGLLALQRERRGWALVLGALTSLSSPVAGLFLALAGVAVGLAGDRRGGIAVAAGAAVALLINALAFPTGGTEPLVPTAFIAIGGVALVLLLLPHWERVLRAGAWLYAGLLVALFIVPTQVGGNATRLGALLAGPVLALALGGRRTLALALAAVPLLYWQWVAPVRDLVQAVGDPAVEEAFYEPLVAELASAAGGEPVRVHALPTRNRWESVHVAEQFPLARGWLRQSESDDFDLFQDDNLTPAAYREWLDERAVSFVAVPDADLDYLADDEAALIEAGLPYLRPVWSNDDWRLYAVRRPAPLSGSIGAKPDSGPGAEVTALAEDRFELAVARPGSYLVRVRWSPYWRVVAGDACVAPEDDWTRVEASAPGTVQVEARFTAAGLVRSAETCP